MRRHSCPWICRPIHPLLKLVEWLMSIVIGGGIAVAIWSVLPIERGDISSLLLFQALLTTNLFVLPPLTMAFLWSEQPLRQLHLGGKWDGKLTVLSIGIIVCAIPLINCLADWNRNIHLPESMHNLELWMQQTEQQAEALLQGFLTYRNGSWWMLPVNLVVLAILPAIGEELTFRGILQSFFRRKHLAVWGTAVVFSFIHFQFYGFVPRMLLGALLGYALVWSNRLEYSILMHAANNALTVIIFYIGTYVCNLTQAQMDTFGTGQTGWLTLVCTPMMAIMIYLYYRRADKMSCA